MSPIDATPEESRRPDNDRTPVQNVNTRPALWSRVASRWRFVAVAVVLAVLAGGAWLVLVGGDGDNGDEQSAAEEAGGATEDQIAAASEFSQCMRDHGIADFPDAVIEADGSTFFEGTSDFGASEEELDAARTACDHILEAVRPAGAEIGETKVVEPRAAGWEEIVPGGDCQCADGSEYSFYAREANPEKVVLFLDGGGACWSAETCAPDGNNEYQTTVDWPVGEGVFAFTNERNPFADYSAVFLPYCTGDLHIGNATTEYTPELTVHHKGYVNGSAALDYLTATFPDAADIVVIGSSAGSFTAPFYAGLLADRYPDAKVTVFADSSGAYADVPELNRILTGDAWGAGDALADWSENTGQTTEDRSAPGFFIQSWRQYPDIVFARHDHAYDHDQSSHLALVGLAVDDLLTLIDANEAQIEAAGMDLHSYISPGDGHVVFDSDDFYNQTVNGTALVDWVTGIVEGEPVDDVHCTDCAIGASKE